MLCHSGNIHKAENQGSTPLHIAAAYGNLGVVEILMKRGANLFSLDDYGRTAARVAAYYQKADCCRYLDTLSIRWQVQNAEAISNLQIKAIKILNKRSKKAKDHKDATPKKLSYNYATAPVSGSTMHPSIVSESSDERRKKLSTSEAMLHNFELRLPSQSSDTAAASSNYKDEKNSTSASSILYNLPIRQTGPLINSLSQLPLNIDPPDDDRHILHHFNRSSEPQLTPNKSSELSELELDRHPMVTNKESALTTFLQSLDLEDCTQQLHMEKLDLDALTMCTEEDLISIGLSLGPRKKVMKGIARRKALLAGSGKLVDTEF